MNRRVSGQWLKAIASTLVVGLVLFFIQTPHTQARPPSATAGPILAVDADADNHSISREIYGMNFADESLIAELHLPVNRWGGNSTTRYNYQNDVTNLANDWYFENARQGDGADPQADSAVNQFIDNNNSSNTKTLLTVPTIGYVANAHHIDNYIDYYCSFDTRKYGPQAEIDYWRDTCGNGILASNGQNVVNDPSDTSIVIDPSFVQGWVSYLHTHFGSSAPTYYALDNEPDLWNETHRDVHPDPMGYDDLRNMAYAYGAAIKAADPDAKVFGPVSWGWTGYLWSAVDWTSGGDWWNYPPDQMAHGNVPFLEWYLQEMADYEDNHDTRILDYLDIHFYTQARYGESHPVALGDAVDPVTNAARLRSTRSLWDPAYYERDDGSWIEDPVMLIPRMHAWVDGNYPGTELALTEYNWGALEHINGALAQADVLGIFGRERLDLATLWGPPNPGDPGAYAFRMYLNYDGSGSQFGDTSIQATSSDQDKLAIYGSKDSSTGALKLMVINKTGGALTSTINLSNFAPSPCAATYTYSPANLHAIVPAWQLIEGSTFSMSFAGNSITLLVIPPGSAGCNAPPSALPPPTLSVPKRGSSTSTMLPKFSWRAAKGAKAYFIQVSRNPDFTDLVLNDSPALKSKFTPPAALGYATYYWRVKTLFADGQTEYSQPSVFDLTLLKSPKKDQVISTGTPKFSWTTVKDATPYHIQVAGSTRSAPWLIDQPVDTTSLVSPVALAPGLYYWRVKTSTSDYSPFWALYVTPAKTPKNGQALTKTQPKLAWGKMPDATGYQVTITPADPPGEPIVIPAASTSAIPPAAFDYGRYTWQIEASTGMTTPPLAFEVTFLKKPTNGSFLTRMPVFQWVKVANAGAYHLEVFQGSETGPKVIDEENLSGTSYKLASSLPRGSYVWQVSTDTGQTTPLWSFIVGP